MHIAIVINTSWNIYNFRKGLIKAFLEKGWKVTAIAPRDKYSAKLVDMGCNFVHVPINSSSTNPARDTRLILRFRTIFKQVDPNVLLMYTIKPNTYGSMAAHRLGIPVINNISGLGTSFLTSGILNRIVKVLYRKSLKHSQKVFFQNSEDRDLFIKESLISESQSEVLPGSGIDLDHFTPMQGIDNNEFTVLMIARLLVEKGVNEYIEAAEQLSQKEKYKFILVGEYPSGHSRRIDKRLLDRSISEGIIDYRGHSDDIRTLIGGSNLVVLPSYREGLPRTLLEGAAMGKPLVASDVPGCKDVVLHGRNGYLCQPGDATDLASKISEIAALPVEERNSMGESSRKLVESQFSEEIVISKYLQAVDGV